MLLELRGCRTGSLTERELREHGNLRRQNAVNGAHQRSRITRQAVGRGGFDKGFSLRNRLKKFLGEKNGVLGRRRAIRHAVSARNQQRQQVVIDEGVLMLELKVVGRIAIRIHIHGHDDQRTGHFSAPSFDGHLARDESIADIDPLVLLGLDTLASLGQPGFPG